jgi:hypothetical protein
MRHAAAIAKRPLPIPVALSPGVRVLVPAASFATPGPIPRIPALDAAVALPTVVADTDAEQLAAVEAPDLDEVNRIAGHRRCPLPPGEPQVLPKEAGPGAFFDPLARRGLEEVDYCQ